METHFAIDLTTIGSVIISLVAFGIYIGRLEIILRMMLQFMKKSEHFFEVSDQRHHENQTRLLHIEDRLAVKRQH